MRIIEIDATPQRRGSYLIYVDREPVVLQGRLFSALVKLACARSHSGGWTRYSDLAPDPEGTGRNAQIVIHALRRILGFDRRELEVHPCVGYRLGRGVRVQIPRPAIERLRRHEDWTVRKLFDSRSGDGRIRMRR